ncbi:hypothetical protein K1T71_000851 [Dendrolimus kikuchii]|uniref:Uncharacterized protein n=1 Tax=Dendrolimus kikuchii TaxID=765133 RepID=A0ACC1DGD3_9NEOP|nr:hypothetical protein K1T71_000851 [Dendrolimus kikuchii]
MAEAESSKGIEPKNEDKIEFKKPVLIGRIGKLPKKAKNETEKPAVPSNEVPNVDEQSETNVKSSLPPAILMKELSTPIPYKEPKWSGLCPDGSNYSLEVLKSGMIVDTVDLCNRPYYVFGRLANCDIIMAHPTISRHHAVLQYKAFAEEGEPSPGWYLQDLGSTHGTQLNRERLKPCLYVRVRVGHQIKLGASTRTYIMGGPDYDCEGESDLTVTEIKQKAAEMKLERERMIKEAAEERERERLEEERKREEQGIDWGMEQTSVHDKSYECQRGKVELPLDDARGRPVVAEVIHKGKKKEAVVACALEACRQLDRAGLLRQAKHESRRRKSRDWSADDYYSSDEDTFLDRTGSIEKKRKKRMIKHGAKEEEQEKPLTYDDLLKKIKDIEDEISSSEKTLTRLRAPKTVGGDVAGDGDELDAYMDSLKTQTHTMAEKAEISKTKMLIQRLKTELAKSQRLAEIARPAHLPPLLKKDSKMAVKVGTNSVVYGKRIRLKEDQERKPKIREQSRQEEAEFVEEVDSDEEKQLQESDSCKEGTAIMEEKHKLEEESEEQKERKEELEPEKKKVYGPMRPPEDYVIPENYFDQETDRDLPEIMEKEEI